MHISKIQTTNYFKPNFGANLQYKNQNITNYIFADKPISETGNKNTDVFVQNVESKEQYGEYHNSINFSILNPLLGHKNFTIKNMHTTNTDITESELKTLDVMYRYFTGFNTLERFENKTLRHTLLEKVHDAAEYNTRYAHNKKETNPEKIFNHMIEEQNPKELGFSEERIDSFKKIAKDLHNDIILSGSEALLDS